MSPLYDVILADPPWRYDNGTPGREVENHYPTMTLDDICALDVPAAPNSVLYLWATAPKVPDALAVMQAWGFSFRSSAVWDKEITGMGYWWRGQHELLFVGTRGKWSPPAASMRQPSVYRQPRGRHSRKPDVVRQQIVAWYPDARRLEMFCRYPEPGWAAWGNQGLDTSVAGLDAERWDADEARRPGQSRLFDDA